MPSARNFRRKLVASATVKPPNFTNATEPASLTFLINLAIAANDSFFCSLVFAILFFLVKNNDLNKAVDKNSEEIFDLDRYYPASWRIPIVFGLISTS